MRCDRLWYNARLLTMADASPGLGLVEDGLVAAREGRILHAGPAVGAPAALDAEERIDLDGRWVLPGLIDCHTHLVHAGDRSDEFERRLAGVTYEEIARAGGGILATVRATRGASEADLVAATLPRLDALLAEGVTTVEIKSGYGLDREAEFRQLRAARALAQLRPVDVRTTYLGLHALPPEFAQDRATYLDLVSRELVPAIAAEGLAEAVDAFCEGIAFSPEETERFFEAARAAGLACKLHADQLSNLDGAALAARHGALSADHLEHTDDAGVAAMAAAGTVAVLLPGAFYVLRETKVPPVAIFRRLGVPMAVATDCNPGTSPLTSPLLAMNMAATLFRLRVDECLAGVTREAARALGMLDRVGTLEPGKWCDLSIWNVERPAELVYRIGFNPLYRRVWRGRWPSP
ncbi:MAG: imidazolonepropionase [Isosphaeraceae bacterium]